MSEIKRQFKGNLGMFLVCAELSKRNLIAMPTSRNTKGYDIVVLNPETNAGLAIQVKCTDQTQKGFLVMTSHWKNYEAKIEENIVSDFVFVDISDPGRPNYFVVSEKEMKQIIKSVIEEYLHKFQQRHILTWEQMLEKEKNEQRKPNPWSIRLSDIEAYKDRWETITDKLQN